jgi:hypothetical protein
MTAITVIYSSELSPGKEKYEKKKKRRQLMRSRRVALEAIEEG